MSKNISGDIDLEYSGNQKVEIVKKLKEKYSNLVEQVKMLIGNIPFNNKIKIQVSQICQLLGYSPETIRKILLDGKDKKELLGI